MGKIMELCNQIIELEKQRNIAIFEKNEEKQNEVENQLDKLERELQYTKK